MYFVPSLWLLTTDEVVVGAKIMTGGTRALGVRWVVVA